MLYTKLNDKTMKNLTSEDKIYYVLIKRQDLDGNELFASSRFTSKDNAEKFVEEADHSDDVYYKIIEI